MKDSERKAMFAKSELDRQKGIKHIQIIKNELEKNIIKMKNDPDNLDITKERTNLLKQLKQLKRKQEGFIPI